MVIAAARTNQKGTAFLGRSQLHDIVVRLNFGKLGGVLSLKLKIQSMVGNLLNSYIMSIFFSLSNIDLIVEALLT